MILQMMDQKKFLKNYQKKKIKKLYLKKKKLEIYQNPVGMVLKYQNLIKF